jgi:hypothetical protein
MDFDAYTAATVVLALIRSSTIIVHSIKMGEVAGWQNIDAEMSMCSVFSNVGKILAVLRSAWIL